MAEPRRDLVGEHRGCGNVIGDVGGRGVGCCGSEDRILFGRSWCVFGILGEENSEGISIDVAACRVGEAGDEVADRVGDCTFVVWPGLGRACLAGG